MDGGKPPCGCFQPEGGADLCGLGNFRFKGLRFKICRHWGLRVLGMRVEDALGIGAGFGFFRCEGSGGLGRRDAGLLRVICEFRSLCSGLWRL